MTDAARPQNLQTLYSDHHGWLRGWLQRRLGCADSAADLAQDTFVRVLTRCEPAGWREPRAFLTAVARGILVDHFRRAELERAYLQELAALPPSLQPSAEEQALMLEALREIERLLSGLSSRARRAFLLSRVEGLQHAQIAAQLGVSVTRVRQYLAEALKRCYLAVHGDAS